MWFLCRLPTQNTSNVHVLFGRWQPSGKQGWENTEQETDANREKLTATGLICVTTFPPSPSPSPHTVAEICARVTSITCQCSVSTGRRMIKPAPFSHVPYPSWVTTRSHPAPFLSLLFPVPRSLFPFLPSLLIPLQLMPTNSREALDYSSWHGWMNHCFKAGLHPKTAVLNSSAVLSKN